MANNGHPLRKHLGYSKGVNMLKKVKKRIFSSNLFKVKEDPNDWDRQDLEYMARCIVRVSKKSPIKMVNFVGTGTAKELRVKKEPGETWNSKYSDRYKRYLEFEVEYEIKTPKTSRKTNIEDVIMLLVMESI